MMGNLDYLNYTNNPPFNTVLLELAKNQPMNFLELYMKIAEKYDGFKKEELASVLMELKYKGLIIEVNGCFLIAEEWLKELVLFLHEFENLEQDITKAKV